ncbi:hypothetical protein HK101_007595 [Irineochytrium annulatum]|nr:hypothetical protein HK101_007595 [Irineochytrium annulatum]
MEGRLSNLKAESEGRVGLYVCVGGIKISLPISLLKLHSFFEKWGDEDSSISMMQALLNDLTSNEQSERKLESNSFAGGLNVQLVINDMSLESKLISSLKCTYSLGGLALLVDQDASASEIGSLFVASLEQHTIIFGSRVNPQPQSPSHESLAGESLGFSLPSVGAVGRIAQSLATEFAKGCTLLKATLQLGFVEAYFNANLLDQIITAQSVLGAEINEIFEIIFWDVDIFGRIRSSKVDFGLRKIKWKVLADAFVVMDLYLQNFEDEPSVASDVETFYLWFDKIHSVFHPSALGKAIDIVLYYKKELERMESFKAEEINQMRNQIKQNTQRLLNSFDIPMPQTVPAKTFIDNLKIIIHMNRFSAAIPLLDDYENIIGSMASLRSDGGGGRPELVVTPAFMLAARSIHFESSQFATSGIQILNFSMQFVTSFDQSHELSFDLSTYPVQNRLLLEDTNAHVIRSKVKNVTQATVNASIKGFYLDVDANIADYVNSLGAIIRKSRERVIAVMPVQQDPQARKETPAVPNAVALAFAGTFEFHAGQCKFGGVHTKSPGISSTSTAKQLKVPKPHSRQHSGTSSMEIELFIEDFTDQIIYLPGISLWIEGKTVLGETNNDIADSFERKIYLELLVHPSDNTLYPSVIALFADIISKLRFGQEGDTSDPEPAPFAADSFASIRPERHSFSFFLRLSETKICLSCQPTSKVALNFIMQEADTLLTFIPDANKNASDQAWSLDMAIRHTSGSLRHAFSPEDCFRGELPDLHLGVYFTMKSKGRRLLIVVDLPRVEGSVNVRHLQDFFLFRRLWFSPGNTVPTTQATGGGEAKIGPSPIAAFLRLPMASNSSAEAGVAGTYVDFAEVVMHLKAADVTTDLGQAIGKAHLNLDDLAGLGSAIWDRNRFRWKEIEVGITGVSITSEGRLSGTSALTGIRLSGVAIKSPLMDRGLKANERSFGHATSFMFNIERVESQVQYQYERILILEVFPIQATFVDNWTVGVPSGGQRTNGLTLTTDTTISIDQINAIMSRRTIPTFLQTKDRLYDIIEEKRMSDVPFSPLDKNSLDLPGSASALNKTGTSEAGFELLGAADVLRAAKQIAGSLRFIIGQGSFSLTRYNFRDPDFAQLMTQRIVITYKQNCDRSAQLGGLVPSTSADTGREASGDGIKEPTTDKSAAGVLINGILSAELGGIVVKKCTAKNISLSEERVWTGGEWFAYMNASSSKNVIIGFPASTLQLVTTTTGSAGPSKRVEFEFGSDFSGQIDIALNVGLYRYLQDLLLLYQKALSTLAVDEASAGDSDEPLTTAGQTLSPADEKAGTPGSPFKGDVMEAVKPYIYVQRGEIKFDPQLKVTGDATPREIVQWLGVNRERIPELVHEFGMVNLSHVISFLHKLYNW